MSNIRELIESAGSDQHYLLMNKDRPIYEFRFCDDDSVQILDIFERPPFWIKDVESWIRGRSAAKHRNDIKKILEDNNALTPKGFTIFTKCLSLSDTLWVKQKDETACWDGVNLFNNPFRDSIGVVLTDGDLGDTSDPTWSTDGSFPKCWVRRNNMPYLVKGGNTGFEPFAETFASKLKCCHADIVDYSIEYSKRLYVYATACKTFTSEGVMFLPYSTVTDKLQLSEVIAEYDKISCKKAFYDMLLLDAVTMNTDRHYRNFGFLLDSDSYEFKTMAPVFDMNYSFGSASLTDVHRPIEEYLEYQSSRMFGRFLDAIEGNVNEDSLSAIEESLCILGGNSIQSCEDWYFERMVNIAKYQIDNIKKMLK